MAVEQIGVVPDRQPLITAGVEHALPSPGPFAEHGLDLLAPVQLDVHPEHLEVIDRVFDGHFRDEVAQPTIRGPLPLAKTLTSLNALSEGRLVAGIGPGSSSRDYAAVGVPFEERWRRFNKAAGILRRILRGEEPEDGEHYAVSEVAGELQPQPEHPVPIWIGSWGSEAGLRRVARLADGWLASGYNTTPEDFGAARSRLDLELKRQGKAPSVFANGLATMWLWITEDRSEAERILADVLGPAVERDPDYLRPRVCVGSAARCAGLLARYAEAGLERVFLWPLGEEARQLELAAEKLI